MAMLSSDQIRREIQSAERTLDEVGVRERRLWDRIRIKPAQWRQAQYPGDELVWVVAVMGRRCLYFNHVEGGWGWGRFDVWGDVSEYHWQQDEIQHAVSVVLLAIDHGGQG
jgi:hypothetical protein